MQIKKLFLNIFVQEKTELYLKPYDIIVTSASSGVLGRVIFIKFRLRFRYFFAGLVEEKIPAKAA